jgi:hypothetical protein
MGRLKNWPRLLDDYIQAARERPFSWADNYCAVFASGAVKAITGHDFTADLPTSFESRAAAYRALSALAPGGVSDLATRFLGDPLPSPKYAQRGDIVLAETPDGPGLGVCIGSTFAAVVRSGLQFFPMKTAQMAWRV